MPDAAALEDLLGALRRVRIASARGVDGRRIRPGDRVGYRVSDGSWIPGSILHLETGGPGDATAWLLTTAPGLPSIDSVPIARCVRLDQPGRRPSLRPS